MERAPEFEMRTERWCAGLRFTEVRPLAEDERALIGRRAKSLQRRCLVAAGWVPVAAGLPFAILIAIPHHLGPAWLEITISLLLLIAASALPTLAALRAQSAWQARRRCLGDLASGEVHVFEGALHADEALDGDQQQLMTLGLLIPSPDVPQRLEVMPEMAAAFHRVNDRIVMVPVGISEVAVGPAYAMRVEVPREVAFLEGAPEVRFLRRTLNEHERAELGAHIRRLRRPGTMAALWAAWCAAWVLAAMIHPGGAGQVLAERWPFVVAQVAVLVGFVFTYLRSLKLAAGLARDTRTGWAFTLHRAPEVEEDEAPAKPAEPERGLEFLPHSRALWNERGRPARWRNLRRAA